MEENNSKVDVTNDKKEVKKGFKKFRFFVVALIFAIYIISVMISFRANYLENLEIGSNYALTYVQKVQNRYTVFAIAFVASYIYFFINNIFIKKGLRKFFEQEKKEMPKYPNKTFCFIFSLISAIISKNMLADKLSIFNNAAVFGKNDPIFNLDIGYYLFSLPFIKNALIFIAGLIVITMIYIGVFYVIVLNNQFDGVDVETLKKNTFVKQEITLAFILVLVITSYIFFNSQSMMTGNMLEINDEEETYLVGASTSDVNIKLWGYRILCAVIIVVAIRFLRFLLKGNFKQSVISLAVIPVYLVGMFVVLVVFNLTTIGKNELDKERKYIAYNIENTKEAYNINIDQNNINDYEALSSESVSKNSSVINNIPLITKEVNLTTIAEHQENSVYYSYENTFLGLYKINGSDELIYITPREIKDDNTISYNNKTLKYTHGYSVVATSATDTDSTGYEKYILSDFTSEDILNITEPRIYFGLEANSMIRVNTSYGAEYDYPTSASTNEENTYNGNSGLSLGFLDRAVLGIYEKDFRMIFANDYKSETKIITNRNVIERAKEVFDDILYDENPYLVITDEGKLVWVLDGYTRTNNYPYSQTAQIDLKGYKENINYIRNSVKVLIDAYDGTTTFYITDKSDPMIMTYWKMYPDLFTDEELPQTIKEHLVYPEFLYNIQANMLNIYHDVSEDTLYRADDIWQITPKTTTSKSNTTGTAMEPYYTVLKNYNQTNSELGLFLTYNKYAKQNITAYLVGSVDNGDLKLSLYKYNSESNVVGLVQLNNQIEQDETIAKELDSLDVAGTKLIKDMIIVPIDNSLLYVEPVYQVMLNESEIPALKKVIVATGSTVAIGDTLEKALNNLFSDDLAVDLDIYNTDNINEIIDSIIKANENFKESYQSGDYEIMGKDLKTLESLITQLENARTQEKEEEQNNKYKQDTSIDENVVNTTNEIVNTIN